jgi:hypothetical protein
LIASTEKDVVVPEVRPRHLLIVLAALAIALTTSVALVLRRLSDATFPASESLAVIGVGMGWVGLGSFYLALGRQRLVLRLAISTTVALAGGAICAAGEGMESPDFATWCGVMLFGMFVVAVPLVYLWARGLRLTHPEHPPLVFWKPRGQFSLWGLLSTLTCTGIFLAIAVKLRFPIQSLFAVMVLCGSIGAITYVVAGTLLSPVRALWPLVAIPLTIILTGAAISSIDPNTVRNDFIVSAATAAIVVTWMLVLRLAGYYLHWPDYTAIETVGPSKRLVDEQGRPVDPAVLAESAERGENPGQLQSNHSSEQSNFG